MSQQHAVEHVWQELCKDLQSLSRSGNLTLHSGTAEAVPLSRVRRRRRESQGAANTMHVPEILHGPGKCRHIFCLSFLLELFEPNSRNRSTEEA